MASCGTPLISSMPLTGLLQRTPSNAQLAAKVRLVEVAGRKAVGPKDLLAIELPPLAIGRAREGGDDHMGVKVRILGAVGAVTEGSGGPPSAGPRSFPSGPPGAVQAPGGPDDPAGYS